jgi:hypothetical protein
MPVIPIDRIQTRGGISRTSRAIYSSTLEVVAKVNSQFEISARDGCAQFTIAIGSRKCAASREVIFGT